MATAGRAVEMAVPWKERKSTSSFPSLSTAPWKSRKKREIPTFPQPGIAPDGKVENQSQVSHFPTRGSQRQLPVCPDLEPKTKNGDRAAARPPPHFPGSPCIGNGNRSPDHPNRRTEESRLRHEEGASLIHSFTPNATHAEQRGRKILDDYPELQPDDFPAVYEFAARMGRRVAL